MAKAVKKKNISKSSKVNIIPFNAYWTKTNYIILFSGIAVIIAGFFFMSIGPWNSFPSLDVSPIFLIVGYLIILPLSILYTKKEQAASAESSVAKEQTKK